MVGAMNNKGLSPVLAAIILIAVTVAVSIAVGLWMKSLGIVLFKDIYRKEPVLDIYNPENSTLRQAYDNCLDELRQQNYTLYAARFQRKVWIKAENFTEFLGLLKEYNNSIVFHDSPKGRGWFLGTRRAPFIGYIWFNEELPDKTIITIYYKLES